MRKLFLLIILFLYSCQLPDTSAEYQDRLVVFGNLNIIQMNDQFYLPDITPVKVSMSSAIDASLDDTNQLYINDALVTMEGYFNPTDSSDKTTIEFKYVQNSLGEYLPDNLEQYYLWPNKEYILSVTYNNGQKDFEINASTMIPELLQVKSIGDISWICEECSNPYIFGQTSCENQGYTWVIGEEIIDSININNFSTIFDDFGFDVLITDHHLPGAELPNANVIINPNLVGELFAGKSLAGVGVAFYLLAALEHHLGISRVVSGFLDLVALGTIADLVKLDHSNRILIEQGVARIRTGSCRPGIIALCEVVDKSQHELTATTLAYYIAPLLNAAGRLDDMSLGVRCLLTDSQKEAQNLAKKLDRLNKDRRNKTTRMRSEALDLVEAEATISVTDLAPIICLSRDDWHEGIVGLVASGIKDKYHRPTFAFARTNEGLLKGSGRSISGFHLRDALVAVDALHPGLIGRFGGHSMAAGLTLRPDGYLQFREAIQSFGEKSLEATDFHQKILTDGVLLDDDLTVEVASMLQNVGPWGQGFPEPLFEGVFILTDQRLLKDRHLKMIVKNLTNGASFDAIAFNFSESSLEVGESLHLVYRLSINDYYTTRRVQLIVEHMQQSENVIM